MRHISFDFWNTIGKPNKTYARIRSELLGDVFGTTAEVAKANYSKVKGFLDSVAETQGTDHGRAYNIDALCVAFGKGDADQQFRDQLGIEFDKLFAEHPPTIDPALRLAFNTARNMGITLSIGSNTNFIIGQTILDHCIGRLPFAFAVFSDQIGVSKPNPDFFAEIDSKARAANPAIRDNSEIIHIGDNDVCDSQGAHAAGMRYASVTDADHTATVLNKLLAN